MWADAARVRRDFGLRCRWYKIGREGLGRGAGRGGWVVEKVGEYWRGIPVNGSATGFGVFSRYRYQYSINYRNV